MRTEISGEIAGRVIGVVGGMGPQSGIALLNSITAQTAARSDQEHLSVILMSFPRIIIDRTFFLEGRTNINPGLQIAKIIRKLEMSGAEVVGIACNTSHAPAIFDVITEQLELMESRVQLLNMAVETCRYISDHFPRETRIGLMATNGTYRSGIYGNLLGNWGYEVILPDADFQESVIHRMIYEREFGIKSNPAGITKEVAHLLDKALRFFNDRGTDVIILGCTEFSLTAATSMAAGLQIVDSTEVMARALIREAVRPIPLQYNHR
jgi:aspartate racemase